MLADEPPELPSWLVERLHGGNIVAFAGAGLDDEPDGTASSLVESRPSPGQRMLLRLGVRCIVASAGHGLVRALDPRAPVYEAAELAVPTSTAGPAPIVRLPASLASWAGSSLPALLAGRLPLWIGHTSGDPALEPMLAGPRSLGVHGGVAVVTATDAALRRRLQELEVEAIVLPHAAAVQRFLQRLALATDRPVSFSARFTSRTEGGRGGKRRGFAIEELFASYGIDTQVWHASAGAAEIHLEARTPDFRRLADLLQRRDASLFAVLAGLGVAGVDRSEIEAVSVEPSIHAPTPRPRVPEPIRLTPPVTSARATTKRYVPIGPPAPALGELLTLMFSQDELRALALKLPDPALIHEVAFDAPLSVVALQLAEALARRGLLGPPLFDALRDERPYRRADIDALARHLLPGDAPSAEVWDSYTLFCRLLDRDSAWNKMARKCDVQDGPILFLLHGSPDQHIALFMDRAHRFLDDEAKDGVRREHQVFEVLFERDYARLQTAEEWEATFRRAMGFAKGRPLADYLRRALGQQALMFLVRGRDAAPLKGLSPTERAALADFLHTRLAVALAGLQPAHRNVRVMLGIEHSGPSARGDPLFEAVDKAMRAIPGAERVVLSLQFPTLEEVLDSVEKFLSGRIADPGAIWPALQARCEAVYRRHEAAGDARNYRDLADDLYRDLSRLLDDPLA